MKITKRKRVFFEVLGDFGFYFDEKIGSSTGNIPKGQGLGVRYGSNQFGGVMHKDEALKLARHILRCYGVEHTEATQ